MASNLELNPIESYFGVKQFHKHWFTFLFLGIGLIILGALAIIGGNVTALATVLFFGILLTISGGMQFIYVLLGRSGQGFSQTLVASAFYTVVGILMLTHLQASAYVLTLIFAVLFTVSGIFRILFSLSVPLVQWGWLFISGLVTLTVGILIWIELPVSVMWVIGLFLGLDLIFLGFYWIAMSITAKNIHVEP